MAGVLVAEAQDCASGDCDCASCALKKSGKFTLPGLEELNKPVSEISGEVHKHEPGDACCPAEPLPHDHHSDAHPDHATHDEHAGHDHGPEPVPHDHDGDGKPDHDSHEGHDHSGHDHGGQTAGGIDLSPEMISKAGIQIHEAEGGTVARSSTFPAEIKLNRDNTAAVSPRYPSIVRQVLAEIGDKVKKGDVLASLENRETMAVYTVSAPLDGIVITKDLAVGETAGDGTVLFEVADLSSVWADISIFPQYQHVLRKGMKVTFIAHDGHSAIGTIKYISPIVSHETRTFTARCVLEGADEDFTPGAFVRARIKVEASAAAVVVPRQAVQLLEGEPVVFIPGDHGFITTHVQTGLADEFNVVIVSGLKPGDRYVAEGAFVLKAHMVTSGMDPHAGHGH